MTWTDLSFAFGSVLTSSKMTQLDDNFEAMANGDAGAPAMTQAGIATDAVGQGQLKAADSTHSRSTSGTSVIALTGGKYALYGRERLDSNATYAYGGGHIKGRADWTYDEGWDYQSLNTDTAGGTWVTIHAGSNDDTIYYYETYVQASPPYDLGDGEVPLFVYAEVDRTGVVIGVTVAEDPPWVNNGPTDIHLPVWDDGLGLWRPRTVAEKNADVGIFPHPFAATLDERGTQMDTVPVLIEPTGAFVEELLDRHRHQGDDLAEMIHKGYIRLDNNQTTHHAPPGVLPVRARHRNFQTEGVPARKLLKEYEQELGPQVPVKQNQTLPPIKDPVPSGGAPLDGGQS